ncbi:caspase family protein [Devosia sp. CAU 1758]
MARPSVILALVVSLAMVQPGLAAIKALVVGIDDYAHKQALRGSVNDARDLITVLSTTPDAEITALTNGEATRAAFEQAWADVMTGAVAGDTILLSFSGHGIRVPQRQGAPATPDGFEKGFLLHGYHEQSASDEILRDEHLYDLFESADRKGVEVVFVADACHAGAAVRGTDPRAPELPFKFQRFEIEPVVATAPPSAPLAARPPIQGLTVFSATVEQMAVHEVLVDGQYRGALTYAIARGLEGAAQDETGAVTAASLRRYVAPLVRLLSQNRQVPQATIPEPQRVILSVDAAQTPTEAPAVLSLAVIGAPGDWPDGVTAAEAGAPADLIWDPQAGQLLGQSGDVLASDMQADQLQDAVNAARVIAWLRQSMMRQPSAVEAWITPSDQFLLEGQQIRFEADLEGREYVTVVNLNARGMVQFVWPLAALGDPVKWSAQRPFTLNAPVTEPFGADNLITITSHGPLAGLHARLAELHSVSDPMALYEAIRHAGTGSDIRIGINSVFTCKSLRSNGQCDSMQPSH